MDIVELIGACARLETLSDLICEAEQDGRDEVARWLLGHVRQCEGNLRMIVTHTEARISALDERVADHSEEKHALRSGVERARNILARIQTRHPQVQGTQRTSQSRGGRGR